MRLTYLHLLNGIDVTWNLAPSVLWTIAECTIGICCVSVPAMRPLFGRLLPDVFTARRSSSTVSRRRAYAMGRCSGAEPKTPVTPTDEERATSQTDLMPSVAAADGVQGRRPGSWSAGEGARAGRLQGGVTITTCEAGGGAETPERVARKG